MAPCGEACAFCFMVDFEFRKKKKLSGGKLSPIFWEQLLSSFAYLRGMTPLSDSPPTHPSTRKHPLKYGHRRPSFRNLASCLRKTTEYIVVKMGSGKFIIKRVHKKRLWTVTAGIWQSSKENVSEDD